MSKRTKWVWIGGLSTFAVTIITFCVSSAGDRRWNEWRSEVAVLEGELETPDLRPALYGLETSGTETSGNAWDSYRRAIALATADEDLEKMVRPAERGKLDPEQLETLFAAHAETLNQVRLGAHCQDAHESIDWSQGFEGTTKNVLTMRGLSNLAVTRALAQIEAGQQVEAVDTLLDMAQLGRDLMHSHLVINEMIGLAVITIPTIEAADQNDFLDRLSPAALDRLSAGLAKLDEGMQRVSISLQGEAVMFAYNVENGLIDELGLSLASWRHGFSSRLMLADAGLRMIDFARQTHVAARGPWSDCDAYLRGNEEAPVNESDLLFDMGSIMRSALTSRLSTIARIRLLRMALEHRRGNVVPRLVDPYGGKLQFELGDDDRQARFWSVGPGDSGKVFLFRQDP